MQRKRRRKQEAKLKPKIHWKKYEVDGRSDGDGQTQMLTVVTRKWYAQEVADWTQYGVGIKESNYHPSQKRSWIAEEKGSLHSWTEKWGEE